MERAQARSGRIAIDIGSTVVKLATLDESGRIVEQVFVERDFEAGIAAQVRRLLDERGIRSPGDALVCSSANGGLRVGIIALSTRFSGTVLRNQVLLAGANPVVLHEYDEAHGHPARLDMLILGGGIDCEDAEPLERRLRSLDLGKYRFASLVYAGNAALAGLARALFPDVHVVDNPLAASLSGKVDSVFQAVRRAYLDDLVHKEGISELRAHGVRPTPEIVNRGFLRAIRNQSSIPIAGGCVLLDIGGATTDLHYTLEVVSEQSPVQPWRTSSVARYVFVDLGIVASKESLLLQMQAHPRLYEFLEAVGTMNLRDVYQALREGQYEPSPGLLSYACLFLAIDRFARGDGPGLATADLSKVNQLLLTGGAAQALDEAVIRRVVATMFAELPRGLDARIDRRYQIWVDGITWNDTAAMVEPGNADAALAAVRNGQVAER